ncbi:MAG: glycosyltransferase [Bryobacteraceae bacterium]|nr:glycosyltransferase [Bryobacteraceae bacterium]
MTGSLIICTYNRAAKLERLFRGLAQPGVVPPDWEILVVDNNSKDDTKQVTERFQQLRPEVRYIFEPTPGKSHALNTGIREARGELLAFTDDDVEVEADWLKACELAFADPEVSGIGGKVLPRWTAPAPDWLPPEPRYRNGPLVEFDLGPKPGPLVEAPYGANLALRRAVFEKHGLFRTDLGPRPGSEIRGEDSELYDRLRAGGERLLYWPQALVYHEVPLERLTKKFFLDWWQAKGYTETVLDEEVGLKFFLRTWRSLIWWGLRWLTSQGSERFQNQLIVWSKRGMLSACYQKISPKGRALPGLGQA